MQKEVPSTRTRSLSVDTTNGGGFVPRHLEEGRAGQLHVALRRAEGFGQRQFRTGVEHTCVPSSSVTVVTASPVFS